MKIAINGDIIDTEDIYKITKISSPYYEYEAGFKIKVFRGEDIHIGVLYADVNDDREFSNKEIKQAKKRLKSLHKSITDIWSNNQSKIPQFNI